MSEDTNNEHKCCCEKFLCKTDKASCPITINKWLGAFTTYDNGYNQNDDTCFCTVICCPIKFPVLVLCLLPCTIYNIGRNKCNHTENKNYLC